MLKHVSNQTCSHIGPFRTRLLNFTTTNSNNMQHLPC